jgi:hypothetical protein
VASDGGIFTYGDAPFYGSTGAIHLNKPIVGVAATPDGGGYWLVASDGGIFTYGDAAFYGSLGADSDSVLGMIIDPSAVGYTLVEANGSAAVFPTEPTSTGLSALSSATPPTSDATTASEPPATPNASQGSDCQPATTPTVTADTPLDSFLSNQVGPGWLGGDGTYSTALPDGQEAIDFSDTLIGAEQPSGTAVVTGIPRNSELVGSPSDLQPDYAGTYNAPTSLIPDTLDSADHWWDGATYIENGKQLIYVNQFETAGAFGEYTGQSGIAVLSVPNDGMPTFESIIPLPTDTDTQWGNAATQSATYTYIYGLDSDTLVGTFYGMKVARVPLGDSLDTSDWQYWNGSAWVTGEENAIPLKTGNELTGVMPQQGEGGYVGVSIPGGVFTDTTVDLSYACSLQGPWSSPKPVYSIPEVSEYLNEMAYIPTFHPELSTNGGLVISYNTNTTDVANNLFTLKQNVHLYQPRFLLVSGIS